MWLVGSRVSATMVIHPVYEARVLVMVAGGRFWLASVIPGRWSGNWSVPENLHNAMTNALSTLYTMAESRVFHIRLIGAASLNPFVAAVASRTLSCKFQNGTSNHEHSWEISGVWSSTRDAFVYANPLLPLR